MRDSWEDLNQGLSFHLGRDEGGRWMRDPGNVLAMQLNDLGDGEDMVHEEGGFQVIDQMTQVEGLSSADSGNKEGRGGFQFRATGFVLSMCRRMKCRIVVRQLYFQVRSAFI